MINDDLRSSVKKLIEPEDKVKVDDNNKAKDTSTGCVQVCLSNVVNVETLRRVQESTLNLLKDYLSKTYGPMGSYSIILKGNNKETILADYSKDGLKVLKSITFSNPIEMAIQTELVDVSHYVESKIGDGTTSAVILSSYIFNGIEKLAETEKIPPRKLVYMFKEIVSNIKDIIETNALDISLEDIHNICMISTNGNKKISDQISNIYKDFGFDVNVDVSISNDQDTKVKIYDGLTISQGYSDPAYINNNATGTADISNPEIFSFQDPVDTPEMVSFLEKIIMDNIIQPVQDGEDCKPTVIVAPMIGRDVSGLLTKVVSIMYEFDQANQANQKPPILIVTNLSGLDEEIGLDIARLCNCKYIRKYIDPELQKRDQENGTAPTLDTIHNFAGSAELVSADNKKTKFINPAGMIDGTSKSYENLINYLKAEIDNAKKENGDTVEIGRLKKRLRCLEANMIEFLVGGISISDRDSLRDLVEDAVKNCASASEFGVGRAANFEGLEASFEVANILESSQFDSRDNHIKFEIAKIIFRAYFDAAATLYKTVVSDNVLDIVVKSLENKAPFNVIDLFEKYDSNIDDIKSGTDVLCSIKTDIEIIDAISKIVTMMATSNQCLLQAPALNRY